VAQTKVVRKNKGSKKTSKGKVKKSKALKTSASKKASGKKKKAKPTKIFIYALALAALGGGGYLVYDKLKRRKQSKQENLVSEESNGGRIVINNNLPATFASMINRTGSTQGDSFPLRKGSRGERVKVLQRALSKTSPSILIDGIFGSQTASALQSGGFPISVDESTFKSIVGSDSDMTLVFNPSKLASDLYKSAQRKDLPSVLASLNQIKTVNDYSAVNTYYKKQSFISKTIVTDLLEFAFKSNESARAAIRKEFVRIGLKLSQDGTWSLQGIKLHQDLITIRPTLVEDTRENKIPVKRNTILGDEIRVASGYTWFKSIDQNILKVPTQDVKYI
jgi:hypothetical protein